MCESAQLVVRDVFILFLDNDFISVKLRNGLAMFVNCLILTLFLNKTDIFFTVFCKFATRGKNVTARDS